MAMGKNSMGRCALHIAVLGENEEMVRYIARTYPETLRIGDNVRVDFISRQKDRVYFILKVKSSQIGFIVRCVYTFNVLFLVGENCLTLCNGFTICRTTKQRSYKSGCETHSQRFSKKSLSRNRSKWRSINGNDRWLEFPEITATLLLFHEQIGYRETSRRRGKFRQVDADRCSPYRVIVRLHL